MKSSALALLVAAVLALTSATGRLTSDAVTSARGDLSFEIYKDAKKEYRWRLKAGNGRVIGMSDEGYTRKDACQHAIDLIKEGAATAKVEDHSTKD